MANRLHAPGKPTVLFYGHYDVQPAEPLDLWTTPPSSPPCATAIFTAAAPPTTKGRYTSTSKRSKRCARLSGKLPINVKVMIEGEEEVGSVNLWDFVQTESRAAEGRRAGRLRHGDARQGRAFDHLWAARLELLPDGDHRTGARPALGSFRRRCSRIRSRFWPR